MRPALPALQHAHAQALPVVRVCGGEESADVLDVSLLDEAAIEEEGAREEPIAEEVTATAQPAAVAAAALDAG